MAGKEGNILKDDGCNTKVISRDFTNKRRHKLDIRDFKLAICHSHKSMEEYATEIVLNTALKIGRTKYNSNWAISTVLYEVVLVILWHEQVES